MWYENATGGVEEFFCYFVPSKFVVIKNPTLVVKEDSDYSYDEKPVMTKLPDGTVRQEVTEQGNPLFQRTFTFSFTTAASAERAEKWNVSGGVFLKRVVEGWWSGGDGVKNPIGAVTFVGTDTDNISQFSTYLDSLDAGIVRLWWSNYYSGLFNKTINGHVTLEYTKVFEDE
jgi:hypothetical protein